MAKIQIAILIGIIFDLGLTAAPTHANDHPDLEKEIQKILAAKYAHDVSKRYQDLFRRIGPDGIRKLKDHKNHGVALRAAWEEIRLTVPEKPAKRSIPVDADALERFLGFAKARLPVSVPRWWEEALLGVTANRRDYLSFRFPAPSDNMYEAAGAGIMAKRGVKVTTRDKKLLLTIGDEAAVLPESIMKNETRDYFSAAIGPKNAYLAVHASHPSGYPLYCVNRKSGELTWKANVWADGGIVIYMGAGHFHDVTIIAQEKQVTVFGGGRGLLYVESFRAEDGPVLYRFCTRY